MVPGLIVASTFIFAAQKPNIIFILADDMGYGELGCFGQKDIKTPNIDKLAAEGMKFTDHYAGSAVCAPSRCVLMTGFHTGHCDIRGNKEHKPEGQTPLKASTVTIAQILKAKGYSTGVIGKWGLGYPGSTGAPNNKGFDFFYGYNCQRLAHEYYPKFLRRNREKEVLKGNLEKPFTDYSHDLCTKEALKFIKDKSDKPFFLYLAYAIPHVKFQVPDLGIYKDKNWTKQQIIQAAMITRMDRDVGTIMDLLKTLGIDDNTLVVFTSDNGAHGFGKTIERFNSSGKLRGRKRDTYDGGIRVPMIVRWPGKIKAGVVSKHVSAFQDWMPTLAEIAGASDLVPKNTDGISMLPTFLGTGKQKQHSYLYWEFFEKGGRRAVRKGDWKAVQYNVNGHLDKKVELYKITDDIGETNDLADSNPEKAQEMQKLIMNSSTPSELWSFDEKNTIKKKKHNKKKMNKKK